MPRRELFTAAERAELIAFPPDEGDLIRLARSEERRVGKEC